MTVPSLAAALAQRLTASLAVDHLAQKIGMSTRNFARVFRRELGITPAEFVTAARTDAARRMLEDTTQPLQRIAILSGFGDVHAMRRAFAKTIGVGPHTYRGRFQKSQFRPAGRTEVEAGEARAH